MWFGEKERVLAIAISVSAVALGVAMGFVSPLLFFDEESGKDEDKFKKNTSFFLIIQAACAGVQLVLNILIYKEKPDSPPSAAAELREEADEGGLCQAICEMLRNKNFMLLTLYFAIIISI